MKLSTLYVLPILSLLFLSSGFAATNSVVNFSHYDERMPAFEVLAKRGVIGAIHEATYPPFQVDAAYESRQSKALSAGLYWGAYHFGDASDPIRQADHFIDVVSKSWRQSRVQPKHGVLLILDFEVNNHYPGGTMRVDQAVAFVERIHQRTGQYPGLYASENRIKGVLNGPAVDPAAQRVLRKCWLWVANYHHTPASTAPWSRWDLWQYTGDGVCDLPRSSYPIAIANFRAAERNIFHGSSSDLRSFWERNAWLPES